LRACHIRAVFNRERIRELEGRVLDLERNEKRRELELAEYLDRFTRLFKRVDQRARAAEQREQLDIEVPPEAEVAEESTMDMRRRFGR
jgi:hypothetical protein